MAYIRTCVQILGEIRRPVRNNCPSSLIIDLIIYCNICRVYVSFTDILFTLFDCIYNFHIDMVFVNFSAHMATLKNRVIYSECATLYKYYVLIKKKNDTFSQFAAYDTITTWWASIAYRPCTFYAFGVETSLDIFLHRWSIL